MGVLGALTVGLSVVAVEEVGRRRQQRLQLCKELAVCDLAPPLLQSISTGASHGPQVGR